MTIGVYASLSTGDMFATLLEHHRWSPDVEVHAVDGSHDQLLCALTNQTVDIAIMTNSRSGQDDRILPLQSERVIATLDARHPLSKMEIIHQPELAGKPILIPQNGPGPKLERLLITKLVLLGLRYVDQRGDEVLTQAATSAVAKISSVLSPAVQSISRWKSLGRSSQTLKGWTIIRGAQASGFSRLSQASAP